MVSLLQRFAAEKRMQTTNVRINAHLLGQSTPASPAASKASPLSSSQVTRPSGHMTRSMSLGRSGDIHPATIYRTLSPKKTTAERRKDLREELERHLQASAVSLGAHIGDECLSRLQGILNRELEKVEVVLQEEVESLFNRSSKDLFRKLKAFVITLVEDKAIECGFSVPQTNLHESEFDARVTLPRHKTKPTVMKPKRVYEELADVSDAGRMRIRPPGPHTGDLRKDLQDQMGTELQDVSERLERILAQRLTHELDTKLDQVRESVTKTASSAMNSLGSDLQKSLENLARARLAEVTEANKGAREVKARPVPQVSRLNLEKVRKGDERPPPYSDSHDQGYKPHSFGHSEPGQPLSQEDLKITSKEDKPKARAARATPPKTKVAESLQRFLENERTLS